MEKLRHFSANTSLHGWSYCFVPKRHSSHTIGWSIILFIAMAATSYLMYINIDGYVKANVSFNLETPTASLDQVCIASGTLSKLLLPLLVKPACRC
jgi:hypothetical protein